MSLFCGGVVILLVMDEYDFEIVCSIIVEYKVMYINCVFSVFYVIVEYCDDVCVE